MVSLMVSKIPYMVHFMVSKIPYMVHFMVRNIPYTVRNLVGKLTNIGSIMVEQRSICRKILLSPVKN